MQNLKLWLGIELDPVSGKEKWVSIVGGCFSILVLVILSQINLGLHSSVLFIGSMGASAVLLFAIPHGPLSQPWPTIAGHTISALIGVTSAKWIAHPGLAAGCAVGLSIGAMHQFKCIHPPGGATALVAIFGGSEIQSLGYGFVGCPVLLNAVALVLIGVVFNYSFKWRRYPAHLNRRAAPVAGSLTISHEAIISALRTLDSFVDISEDDLIRLCQILNRAPDQNAERLAGKEAVAEFVSSGENQPRE